MAQAAARGQLLDQHPAFAHGSTISLTPRGKVKPTRDDNARGNVLAGVVLERVVAQPCRGRNMDWHLASALARGRLAASINGACS